eukprot:TRINITY_DN24507_c0_g1_i1.p1 TRINITY_DN24507_c0_g1~~TRINITY_DN24507_c0_g1_i1.p1  ORF type:complete len:222 (+),score=21.47 TRINITY_DN24507_c0_g1_i1:29-667(+)
MRLDAQFTAVLFCNRGAARQKLSQADIALEDFNTAILHSPKYAKAFFRRGLIYLELEQYKKAESDFEAVAVHSPHFVGLPELRKRARMWSRHPPKRNFYAVLGVGFDATATEVKRAYRAAALKWHPDKNVAEKREVAERRFKDIQEAYETLSDPKLRGELDSGGSECFFGDSNPSSCRGSGGMPDGFPFGPWSSFFQGGQSNGRGWNSWHFG